MHDKNIEASAVWSDNDIPYPTDVDDTIFDDIPEDTILVPPDVADYDNVKDVLHDMGAEHHSETLFRDDVIREICSILISENKPNALLIGPAGAGKTNVVEELARRIKAGHKGIPQRLRDYTIYSLSLSDIVSGSGLVGDLERKVRNLVNRLESEEQRSILFLDEVHMLFGGETYKKVAQMLKPALSRGRFMVIAATTTQEVRKVEEDPAFNRRFTRVLVDELSKEQTETVLKSAVKRMEEHYGVKIDFKRDTAKMLVEIADEFCSVGSHRPDNALTLMDRAVASRIIELQARAGKENRTVKVVLDNTLVEDTAFRLTSGNSSIKAFDEKKFRAALSGIRGQQDILDDITDVIRLYDLHLHPYDRPLTFLFAGPSGVGKSAVAKIIAREYIGEKPIVLNMAEYNSPSSVNRIIGAPAGYIGSDSNRELPFDVLDTNPYQVILLDEFEKCDRTVQRLFMSVFDEGVMVTSHGKEIDFSKSIIIATTNAGCTEKTGSIGFVREDGSNELSVLDLSGYFDTELINRFCHKYTFHSISKSIYRQIIRDCLEAEITSLKSERIGNRALARLKDAITDETVDRLCRKSYNVKFGARPVGTVIREYVDNMVLSYMDKKNRPVNKAQLSAVETS